MIKKISLAFIRWRAARRARIGLRAYLVSPQVGSSITLVSMPQFLESCLVVLVPTAAPPLLKVVMRLPRDTPDYHVEKQLEQGRPAGAKIIPSVSQLTSLCSPNR
jgi:hypothetical protein